MGWEPRGEWDAELIGSLCKELDLIPVVDPLKSQPIVVGKIRYFRLHGTSGPRHRFQDEELQRLKQMCADRTSSYILFNNLAMTEDAQRFMKMM